MTYTDATASTNETLAKVAPSVGIIGAGAIAEVHARALLSLGVRLCAVAGPEEQEVEQFASQFGIPTRYQTAVKLIEDANPVAVIVASPNEFHSEQTLAALDAAVHVLCEVPMAMSYHEAARAVDKAREVDRVLMVAHTLRYNRPHSVLAGYLRRDAGAVLHVLVRSMSLRHINIGWTGRIRSWTDNVLWHGGMHAVDTALWFLEEPVSTVLGACGPTSVATGNQMDVSAILISETNRIANIALSFNARIPRHDVLVVTESGTFEIRGSTLTRDSGEVLHEDVDPRTWLLDAVRSQDADFLWAVTGHKSPRYTAEEALAAIRVVQDIEDTRSRG